MNGRAWYQRSLLSCTAFPGRCITALTWIPVSSTTILALAKITQRNCSQCLLIFIARLECCLNPSLPPLPFVHMHSEKKENLTVCWILQGRAFALTAAGLVQEMHVATCACKTLGLDRWYKASCLYLPETRIRWKCELWLSETAAEGENTLKTLSTGWWEQHFQIVQERGCKLYAPVLWFPWNMIMRTFLPYSFL